MKIDTVTPVAPVDAKLLPRCRASLALEMQDMDEHIVVEDNDGRGASWARNFGIARSEAGWVRFLDADDLSAPFAHNHLRELERAGRLADTVLVCGAQVIVVDGLVRGTMPGQLDLIERINPFVPSQVFVKRSALSDVGMFDTAVRLLEDWDLWLRLRNEFGQSALMMTSYPVCYYTIDTQRRASRNEGMEMVEFVRQRHRLA